MRKREYRKMGCGVGAARPAPHFSEHYHLNDSTHNSIGFSKKQARIIFNFTIFLPHLIERVIANPAFFAG
jgi:hypothetical protein